MVIPIFFLRMTENLSSKLSPSVQRKTRKKILNKQPQLDINTVSVQGEKANH